MPGLEVLYLEECTTHTYNSLNNCKLEKSLHLPTGCMQERVALGERDIERKQLQQLQYSISLCSLLAVLLSGCTSYFRLT